MIDHAVLKSFPDSSYRSASTEAIQSGFKTILSQTLPQTVPHHLSTHNHKHKHYLNHHQNTHQKHKTNFFSYHEDILKKQHTALIIIKKFHNKFIYPCILNSLQKNVEPIPLQKILQPSQSSSVSYKEMPLRIELPLTRPSTNEHQSSVAMFL